MNDKVKTKQQLINELQELRASYDSLKVSIKTDLPGSEHSEDSLLKNREMLNNIEQAAKIGGWEFDVETMVQTWTEEIFHILEIDTTHGAPDVPEGIGFIDPEYQPMALLGIQRAIEFGEPYNQEWVIITAKGNKCWVNAIATPYQENGKTKSVSGSFQDITKRKLTEIALIEKEENLSITLNSIGDAVISTDKNGFVVSMNPVAERLCGWNLTDALGKPLAEVFIIINAETRQIVADPVKNSLEKGEIVGLVNHTILISKNGAEYQIADSAAPIRNKKGVITGVVLVFSDITESYLAQKQIKESEERYGSLLDNLEAGIVVHAPDTSVVMNNHRASELLGLTDHQMRGKASIDPAWKFIHENNTLLTIDEYPVNRVVNGRQPIKNQLLGIHQPGKNDIVWVSVNGFPLLNNKGEITEIVISFIDISKRKKAEILLQNKTEEIEVQNEEYQQINEELNQTIKELIAAKEQAENNNKINEARLNLIQYSENHTIDEILEETINIAERISNSNIGFFHFVENDQINLFLQNWSTGTKKHFCNAEGKGSHYPIDKAGVWADCVYERKPIIHNNYDGLTHKKGLPEGHAPLIRELVVPIIYDDKIKGILGIGNKETEYNQTDLEYSSLLAYFAWEIVEKKRISNELIISEEKLRKSEEQNKAIFENSLNPILIADDAGNYLKVNEAAAKMFHYPVDRLLQMNVGDLQTTSLPNAAMRYQEYLAKGYEIGEFDFVRPDKSEAIVQYHAVRVRKNLNLCILSDITDRKHKEEEIIKTGRHYQALIEKAPDGIALIDVEGNFKYISTSAKKMFGYIQTDEVNGNPAEYTHPDDLQMVLSELEKIFADPTYVPTLEYRFIDKLGYWHWVETTFSNLLANPSVESIVLNFRDITERKMAEVELREKEVQFQNLANSGPSLIWTSGTDKLCNYFNERWMDFTGRNLEQELGNGWVKGVHPDDFDLCLSTYVDAFEKHEPFEMEYRLLHVSGKYRWILDLGTPNYNSKGEFIGYIGNCFDITDRKQTEEALRESKNRSQAMLDAIPDLMFRMDSQGVFLDYKADVNDPYFQSGMSIIGKRNRDITPPEFADLIDLNIRTTLETGKLQTFVYQLPIPGRGMGNYEARMVTSGADEVTTIVRDITERLQADDKLEIAKLKAEESEQRLFAYINSIPDVVCYKDGNGRWLLANNADLELFCLQGVNYYGKTDFDLSAYTHEIYKNAFMSCMESDESAWEQKTTSSGIEVIPTAKGEKRVYEVTKVPVFHANGERKGLAVIARDVSRIYEIQEKLKEKLALLRIAGEKAKLGGWNVDLKENRSYWSDEVAAIHEMPAGYAPLVQDGINFYAPEWRERITQVFTDCIQQGIPYDEEMEIITAGGKRVWINTIGEAVRDDNGTIFKVQGAFQDISGRKKTEEELIAARKKAEESDKLKSAFLANMSHEIRTPMNGILGFAELLKDSGLTGDQQQEYITIIGKSGNRMLNIINDIVDISKIEAGLITLDIKESNINEQIEYIYTFFKPEVAAKGMKLSFRNSLPAREATINTDREKVYSILTNLVKNAIKYTNQGSIEFGYKHVVEKGHAHFLQFYVKDTGIGIPKDRQDAIFERFIQVDITDKMARQGAGLGLAITKSFVEMLGGKIWVESEMGIGSTFYFTLPYHTEQLKETLDLQHTPSVKIDTVRKLKILIAEDDDVSEMLISISVKAFGKEILKAGTGVEAVEACRNNPDIDLILMDIRMPEMGGYEATRLIRELNKEAVIIAQTAYGLAGDKEKILEAGFDDYIAKPIKKDELLALIYKHFGK